MPIDVRSDEKRVATNGESNDDEDHGSVAAVLAALPLSACDFPGLLLVIAIFTAVRFILAPLMPKLSLRYARALTGGIALGRAVGIVGPIPPM